MSSVVVIGAGLAGLNCARTLIDHGIDTVILEKSDRIGGRIKTDLVDGFRFDHGFQVINPSYSEIQGLNIEAALDLQPLPKGYEIALDDKGYLVGDPRSSVRFLKGDISTRTGSLKAKIAFLTYLLRKPTEEPFGAAMKSCGTFYSEVLKGFLDGVFLANSDQVSSTMAHELLHWFMKGNPGVPALGMAELPRLLSSNVEIRLNCAVHGINGDHVETSQGNFKSDAVVIAADPNSTQNFLGRPALAMNASWTWYHSVDSEAVKARYLKVLSNDPLINTVAISNIAENYAPKGATLISSTTLHEITEKEATAAVARAWKLSLSELKLLSMYSIRESLPFHGPHKPVQSPQRINDRVVVAGDAYAIPAQQGALMSGRLAAEMIISGR